MHFIAFSSALIAISRNPFTSDGIVFIIFSMSGFLRGDLNPDWTVRRQAAPEQPMPAG